MSIINSMEVGVVLHVLVQAAKQTSNHPEYLLVAFVIGGMVLVLWWLMPSPRHKEDRVTRPRTIGNKRSWGSKPSWERPSEASEADIERAEKILGLARRQMLEDKPFGTRTRDEEEDLFMLPEGPTPQQR